MNLRVLVVDDTIMYRKVVGDILAEIPGVEVVGTANRRFRSHGAESSARWIS